MIIDYYVRHQIFKKGLILQNMVGHIKKIKT